MSESFQVVRSSSRSDAARALYWTLIAGRSVDSEPQTLRVMSLKPFCREDRPHAWLGSGQRRQSAGASGG